MLFRSSNGTNYQWNTSANTQTINVSPLTNTTYYVFGNTLCGIDTAFHPITVVPKPQADFSFTPAIPSIGSNINLTYLGSPVTNYFWYDDNNYLFSNQMNPIYNIQNQNNTIILLYVQNQYGCIDSISKTINTDAKINVWVPNSFTPNGDGRNDIFKVETNLELTNFNLYIYNRWGQVVFESTDINYGWDGKYMREYVKADVYVWILTYKNKYSNQLQRQQGSVSVIY